MYKRITAPATGTMIPYYESYRHLLVETDILQALVNQQAITFHFVQSLTTLQGEIIYAPGKWSVKEVLGHMIDAERILSYRILCFLRGEKQSLPGFDENEYAKNSNYSTRKLENISEELKAIRASTIILIQNMDFELLDHIGKANVKEVSIRAIIYFILVHERHHLSIIKNKYL